MYSVRLTVWNKKIVKSRKDLITNIEGLRVAITCFVIKIKIIKFLFEFW